jgi:hypothetical protein
VLLVLLAQAKVVALSNKIVKLALIAMPLGLFVSAQANEAEFASRLSEPNQKIFREQFTPQQKKVAQALACTSLSRCDADRSLGKMPMDPNEAVEKIFQDTRD